MVICIRHGIWNRSKEKTRQAIIRENSGYVRKKYIGEYFNQSVLLILDSVC